MSERSLTGYDNHDAVSGQPDEEVYLYEASGTSALVCGLGGVCDPGAVGNWGQTLYPSSNLIRRRCGCWMFDDGGRVFFNSSDGLVPQDVNGT
jgi:hypothetical protein